MSLHVGLDLGGTNVKCAVVDDALARARDRSCPNGAVDGRGRGARAGRARSAAPTVAPFGAPATAGLALPGHFDAARGRGVLLPNLRGDWVGPRDRRRRSATGSACR